MKKISIFQFQFVCMKDLMLEKHKTHGEQVINMFQSTFEEKSLKDIKDLLHKNMY